MTIREVEFKYDASGITLADFKEMCIAQDPSEYIISGGDDHFYANETHFPDLFLRHRIGPDQNELTFKKKFKETPFVRMENTLALEEDTNSFQVRAFIYSFGFDYISTINKTTHTYLYPTYSTCYYVCRNKDLKEVGRFIEIEVNDDPKKSEEELFRELLHLEILYAPLGIDASHRIIPSLFELFKNST